MCNEERVEEFKNMAAPGVWRDTTIEKWGGLVGRAPLGDYVAAATLSRTFLRKAAADKSVSDRDLLWSILAWGGMKIPNANRLMADPKREGAWARVVGCLRTSGLDRKASYELCCSTVAISPGGGIGPAYFTKLIFFANPRHDGYIMDGWTARSVNFLCGNPPVVRMTNANFVSLRNDSDNYEKFCCVIEYLARECSFAPPNESPEYIEQCLFSTGGRKPACWRELVKKEG